MIKKQKLTLLVFALGFALGLPLASAGPVRGPVDHVRYVPEDWVKAPGQVARWEPLMHIYARPGDFIEYRLEPMSMHKFQGVDWQGDDDRYFEAPVISPSGRHMTIKVKPNTPPMETKSDLILKAPNNDESVKLDPLVIIGHGL